MAKRTRIKVMRGNQLSQVIIMTPPKREGDKPTLRVVVSDVSAPRREDEP